MDVLDEKGLEGVPPETHVLEIVESRADCAFHPHFGRVECVPLREVVMAADRYRRWEPILLHCDRPERCRKAAAELERVGYTRVFGYKGDLRNLGPLATGWGRSEAVRRVFSLFLGREDLKSLLKEAGEDVVLLDVVNDDEADCAIGARVRCVPAGRLEEAVRGLGRGQTIVVHCGPSVSYPDVVGRLQAAGFERVLVFEEGFSEFAWGEV
ncbi:MAG: rhodanese-like domain-containing protein [Pseudomonadota bacterium]